MLYRIQSTALGQSGNTLEILPNATVSVLDAAGALARIYADADQVTELENPTTADNSGGYDFYVDFADYYDISVSLNGKTVDERVYTFSLDRLNEAELSASTDAEQTALDRLATAGDVVQTGLDVAAIAADAVQTALDRVQTGLDVTAAETARDLAETYAGVDYRAGTWAELALISGLTGEVGYVNPDDTGTHTDPITALTVPNEGVYTWAADGLGSAQAERTASTGVAVIKTQVDDFSVILDATDQEYEWSVKDSNGDVILAVGDNGQLVADFALVPKTFKTGGLYDFEVNFFPVYGQSLSVGQARPAISTAQGYDNVMFTRGMRPQYDYPLETPAQWYAGFVPAVEIDSPESSVLGETPCMGAGDMLKQLILDEDGKAYTDHTYKLLLSAPGFGALTLAALDKGSVHYDRLIEQSTYLASVSETDGATYVCPAVGWVQGESDYISNTTAATYETLLNTMIADLNTDIKAATGQTKDVVMISYQVSSHIGYAADDIPDIAQAQLNVEASNPLFVCAGPIYHLPYGNTTGHLNPVGSRMLGAYLGIAYKRQIIDGETFRPIRILSTLAQGSVLQLTYTTPVGKLVWDTTIVPEQTDYGFELFQSDGTTPITISSVEITDYDRVKITAAATIPAGAIVRYAWNGNTVVGLGNLRDTQGDTIKLEPEGERMDNWACIEEVTI